MNEILKAGLSLSLSGSLLILLLFLLRPLYKERLSKQWQYYIWLVVVARLLLPFAPETNLMTMLFQGIDRTIEQTEIVSPYTQQGGITDIPQTDDMENGQNNLHSRQTEPVELASNPVRNIVTVVWKNLWLGWLVVALILFIRKITVYQDFVKYIRAGCVEVAEIDLLERFGTLIERNKVKTTVELYTNNLISSPLLIGFFRPSIVLPSADLSPVDFEYTILHELTHYKRRDMFYKWLVQFSVCVHWFNPLVYLMSREVGRACELSCDEAVIKALDLQEQRAYGDTLLNAMRGGGNYKDSLASVTLNESKELLKERLDSIMKYHKKPKVIVIVSTVLTILFMCGATFIGVYASTPENTVNVIDLMSITPLNYTFISATAYDSPYWIEMDGSIYSTYKEQIEGKIAWLESLYNRKNQRFIVFEGITETEATNTIGINYMFEHSAVYRDMALATPWMFQEPWGGSFDGTSRRDIEYERCVFYVDALSVVDLSVSYELTTGALSYWLVSPNGTIMYESDLTDRFEDKRQLTLDQGLWSVIIVKSYENNEIQGEKNISIQ